MTGTGRSRREIRGFSRLLPGIFLSVILALGCASGGGGGQSPPSAASRKGVTRAEAETDFSASRAWHHLEELAGIGPRVVGTKGSERARAYLSRQLDRTGFEVREIAFALEVEDPWADAGEYVEGVHLIGVLEGASPDVLMLASHYDTAELAPLRFLGVNDGASGPALLLELGRVLSQRPLPYTLWLVFLDGDAQPSQIVGTEAPESFAGARALAAHFAEEQALDRIRLAVFYNQVCDAELAIARDLRSHPVHQQVFRESAFDLGYSTQFPDQADLEAPPASHLGFLDAGMQRVVAVVDDRFGGPTAPGQFWRTEQDALEQCAPESLAAVGEVSDEALARIAERLEKIDRFAQPPAREGADSALGSVDSAERGPLGAPEVP